MTAHIRYAAALLGGAAVLGGGAVGGAATVSGQAVPAPAGFVRPVTGAVVTQPFGCTSYVFEPRDSSCPQGHFHSGIDLAEPQGRPVVAAAGGVATVAFMPYGYGLYVVLTHGGGMLSLYGHLSAVDVSDGEQVSQGEVIGAVGSTGNSTGPHLHFEIRRDGIPEDPRNDVTLP